jgi:hypothetical protein
MVELYSIYYEEESTSSLGRDVTIRKLLDTSFNIFPVFIRR